jgi:GTPase SAR1 family protein
MKEAATGLARLGARLWVSSLSGPKYLQELAARQCPRCGELLPHNIEHTQNRIVGLVGGVASGKSHYIASLVHDLKRGEALAKIGCTRFAPVNQDVDMRYKARYHDPVFVRREPLPFTPRLGPGEVNRPLIYEMIFKGRTKMEGQKLVNLTLFDASGEQIQDEEQMVLYSRYILNAAAIIVLVDPLTMPDVRERLPHHMRPEAVNNYDAFDILNTVTRTYERYRGLKPGTPINVPVVITIAKSDLLRYALEGLGLQAAFTRHANYDEGFDLDDFGAVSEEVQEVIARLAGPGLIDASRATFPNLAFSAISATGSSPDSTGYFSAVTPRRVLDPLLWSLWKLNMISATRRAHAADAMQNTPRTQQAM